MAVTTQTRPPIHMILSARSDNRYGSYGAGASPNSYDTSVPSGYRHGAYGAGAPPNSYDTSVPSGYRHGAYGAGAPPNSYDTSVPSGYQYGAYGAGASANSYDTSASSGYRYGGYGAGAPPNSYDTSAPSGYRYSGYGVDAPSNPYASAVSGYGHDPYDAGSSYGADAPSQRNPYDFFPARNPYAPTSDLYGEDPTSSLERGSNVRDQSIYDPLGAPPSGQSRGVDSATEPYGLSPYLEPKPKSPEQKVDSGILGFNPFDAEFNPRSDASVHRPALVRSEKQSVRAGNLNLRPGRGGGERH